MTFAEPRRPSWAAGLLLLGCRPPAGETDTDAVLSTPAIATFAWACDAEAGDWTLAVTNTSWSGGGALWLTADGAYTETHPVRVDRQEADGRGESMALTLGIAADWRDVALGSSTAFLCAEAPALRFVLEDRAGDVADCRYAGAPEVWASVPEAPPCDVPWQP